MAERLNRTEREEDTRSVNVRERAWEPSTKLPTPKKNQDTLDFRYVRVSVRNEADMVNLSQAIRDGWEPVAAVDYPELKVMNDISANSQFADGVHIGGCLLCSRPKEIGEQRRRYAAQESARQARSVKESYMSDNDKRMNKFAESNTRIKSFG